MDDRVTRDRDTKDGEQTHVPEESPGRRLNRPEVACPTNDPLNAAPMRMGSGPSPSLGGRTGKKAPSFLQKTYGNLATLRSRSAVIQAKSTLSRTGDRYESEADRVAERVLNMPGAGAQLNPT